MRMVDFLSLVEIERHNVDNNLLYKGVPCFETLDLVH